MVSIFVYLWVGLVLVTMKGNAKHRVTWKGTFLYIVGWLPIEVGDYLSDQAGVLWRFYLRIQGECEDAVLRTLAYEVSVTSEALYDGVLYQLQGQEPGWLIYHGALRSLRKRELIHKQTRLVADHLHEYRNVTWYNLSKTGIREVRERGLQ